MRSLIPDMSGAAGAPSRGADLTSFNALPSLSDCERRPAISLRNAPTDFSSASTRAAVAGSAAEAVGLLTLASTLATRPLNASTIAVVTSGAAGGACTAGQPSIQPTAITSAAATAPDSGAITQGETGAEAGA